MAKPQLPPAPGNSIVKKFLQAKRRTLTKPNRVTDLASPNTPRTVKAGKGVSKSSKTSTSAGPKTSDPTRKKVPKVTKAKIDSSSKNPFARSSRLNYKQLRKK